jgi:hypothetical protein
MGLMKLTRSLLLGALLAGLAGGGAAAQQVNSQCPEYPGQTHAQILRGVEGRLDGDWGLAIKTTERSVKRLKDKGQDASQAQLFAAVLTCLRDEVKAGLHADAVAAAREAGKPEPGTPAPPSKADVGGGAAVQSSELAVAAPAPAVAPLASPAPAPAPAPATDAGGIQPLAPGAAAPLPAPGSGEAAQPAPVIVSSGGVVLPGTAESYGQAAAQPAQGQVATTTPAAPANGDYSGLACVYFTRPYEEIVDGLRHVNRYNEGEWACHAGTMYACNGGQWESKGACDTFNRWETRLTTTLEATPR